jgi:hypothetical protein
MSTKEDVEFQAHSLRLKTLGPGQRVSAIRGLHRNLADH